MKIDTMKAKRRGYQGTPLAGLNAAIATSAAGQDTAEREKKARLPELTFLSRRFWWEPKKEFE